MKKGVRMSPSKVWWMLCGLTLVSLWLTEGTYRRAASIGVVMLAAAKSHLVIVHYMEVQRAARHWQLLYRTWIYAVVATIVLGYVLSLKSSNT